MIKNTSHSGNARVPNDISFPQIGNAYTKIRLITPNKGQPGLVNWIQEHIDLVKQLYSEDRILLFKGFAPLTNKAEFSTIVSLTSESKALSYAEPSTPRTQVQENIYTSTEYPKEQTIAQHNEHSYTATWPGKLFFYCEQPALTGGATPVCNSHEVYKLIPEHIVKQFESKGGIMYARNFTEEMDIQWPAFFNTTDKQEVEAYCKAAKMEFEWLDEDRLRIYQVSQVSINEKAFNQKVWFNQAHLFHYSNLPEEIANCLIDIYGIDNLPRNAFHGDGSPIEVEHLNQVRKAYEQAMFRFDWETGDLLLMDNVNFTHGRDAYSGSRSLIVSMSEEDGIENYERS